MKGDTYSTGYLTLKQTGRKVSFYPKLLYATHSLPPSLLLPWVRTDIPASSPSVHLHAVGPQRRQREKKTCLVILLLGCDFPSLKSTFA